MSILDQLDDEDVQTPSSINAVPEGPFMNEEIEKSLKPLDDSHALQVKNDLCGILEGIHLIEKEAKEIVINGIEDSVNIKKALLLRRKVTRIRQDVEKERKSLKERFLRPGQAIDGIAKILTAVVTPIENDLKAKEKTKENFLDNREEYRRKEVLAIGGKIAELDLRNMTDEKFAETLIQVKKDVEEESKLEALCLERAKKLTELGIDPVEFNLAVMTEERFNEICETEKEKKSAEKKRIELITNRSKELSAKNLMADPDIDLLMPEKEWAEYLDNLEKEAHEEAMEAAKGVSEQMIDPLEEAMIQDANGELQMESQKEIDEQNSDFFERRTVRAYKPSNNKISFEQLVSRVVLWGEERDLYMQSNIFAQTLKAASELGELADNVIKNRDITDDIGDVLVCLIHVARFKGLSLTECLEHSYEQIKDRKGKFEGLAFVKEGDYAK